MILNENKKFCIITKFKKALIEKANITTIFNPFLSHEAVIFIHYEKNPKMAIDINGIGRFVEEVYNQDSIRRYKFISKKKWKFNLPFEMSYSSLLERYERALIDLNGIVDYN